MSTDNSTTATTSSSSDGSSSGVDEATTATAASAEEYSSSERAGAAVSAAKATAGGGGAAGATPSGDGSDGDAEEVVDEEADDDDDDDDDGADDSDADSVASAAEAAARAEEAATGPRKWNWIDKFVPLGRYMTGHKPAIEPLEPVTLEFIDVDYTIRPGALAKLFDGARRETLGRCFPAKHGMRRANPKHILQSVSGVVRPGQVLAIMGPSGAGKTSLLNILAARVSGYTGDVLFNGHALNAAMRRKIGYVTQDDHLFKNLTVHETLTYAANFKLPSEWTLKEKKAHVNDVIATLGLNKCRNVKIGGEMVRGISGGQRKRVSIGVELLTNPSLLFLDEPTSGLDSTTSAQVFQLLTTLAREQSRTIVCTIHQPSSKLYDQFDTLMLLSEGEIVYMGSAKEAPAYFARLGHKCPQFTNPAEYFMDLCSAPVSGSDAEAFRKLTARSSERQLTQVAPVAAIAGGAAAEQAAAEVDAGNKKRRATKKDDDDSSSSSSDGISDMPSSSSDEEAPPVDPSLPTHRKLILKYREHRDAAASEASQAADSERQLISSASMSGTEVAKRTRAQKRAARRRFSTGFWTQTFWLSHRALRNYFRDKRVFRFRLAQTVVLALIVGLMFLQVSNGQSGVQNRQGALFFIMLQCGISSMMGVLHTFSEERVVVLQERAGKSYHVAAYFIGKTVCELPFQLLEPLLWSVISYWMVGFQTDAGKFFIFLGCLLMLGFCGQSTGLALAAATPNAAVATLLASLVLVFQLLFAGLFVNLSSVPVFLRWIRFFSFPRYGYLILLQNEFKGLHFHCDDPPCAYNNGHDALKALNADGLGIWQSFVCLACLMLSIRLIGYIFLRLYKPKH